MQTLSPAKRGNGQIIVNIKALQLRQKALPKDNHLVTHTLWGESNSKKKVASKCKDLFCSTGVNFIALSIGWPCISSPTVQMPPFKIYSTDTMQ